MTKKRRGKNRRGFVAIPFDTSLALASLADDTVLSAQILAQVFAEDLYIISIDAFWGINGVTAEDGPIEVGFSHDDYTVAEINEALVVALVDPDNKISQERSRRLVRRAGLFTNNNTSEVLNDGKKIRTPMKFMVGDNHGINMWAKNKSGATIATGQVITLTGTIYGRWVR